MTDDEKLEVINRWCGSFYTSSPTGIRHSIRGGYWYGYLRYGKSAGHTINPEVLGPGTAETVLVHEAYKLVNDNVWQVVVDIQWEAS